MESKDNEPLICIREVNENLRRVRLGMPLTRSLRELNNSCEFKKKYEEMDKIQNEKEIKEEYNKRQKVFRDLRKKNPLFIFKKHKPPKKLKRCDYCEKKLTGNKRKFCNDKCTRLWYMEKNVSRYKEDSEYRAHVLETNKISKRARLNKSTTIDWKQERKKIKLPKGLNTTLS